MSTIMRLLILTIYLVILPLLAGTAVCGRPSKAPSVLKAWCNGSLFMMSAFQLAVVPLILTHRKLTDAVFVWHVILAAAVLLLYRRSRWKNAAQVDEMQEEEKWTGTAFALMAVCLILLTVQCSFYVFGMHIDDDDARYVANALAASRTNTMFRYHPNTGFKMNYFMGEIGKEVTSPLMMYYAALSRISGIHATILIHTVLPPFLVLLAVSVMWMLAGSLWPESREKRLFFLAAVMVMTIMGNVSIYTGSTFALMRIWQGKSLTPAVFVPFILMLLFRRYLKGNTENWYLYLLNANTAACLSSGMGIFISAILTGISGLILAVRERRIAPAATCVLCCIPNAVYTGIYLLVWKTILR